MKVVLTEILYLLIGFIIFVAAYKSAKSNKPLINKIISTLFWGILGVLFFFPRLGIIIGGSFQIPDIVSGYLVLMLAVLAALNKIVSSDNTMSSTEEYRIKKAAVLKNKIFIPALSIALFTFVLMIIPITKSLGSLVALGIASLLSLLLASLITRESAFSGVKEGRRLLEAVGPMNILPQLLAALGAVFAASGVGEVIATLIGGVIPEGNRLAGVIAYCAGMAVFTIIMGNGFAAFAVITAGIGVPFVIMQGGNPAIVGALGLTAGYCGTLLTPMAANFNIVPASLLEMNDLKYGVIKQQALVACALWILHVVIMYSIAF